MIHSEFDQILIGPCVCVCANLIWVPLNELNLLGQTIFMSKTRASGNFNYGFFSSHSNTTAIVLFHCSGYGNLKCIYTYTTGYIVACINYIKSKIIVSVCCLSNFVVKFWTSAQYNWILKWVDFYFRLTAEIIPVAIG